MIKGFITVFMFFLFANVLYANTYIWTGSTSKNFTVSTNWSPSRITPAITDTLQFITTSYNEIVAVLIFSYSLCLK